MMRTRQALQTEGQMHTVCQAMGLAAAVAGAGEVLGRRAQVGLVLEGRQASRSRHQRVRQARLRRRLQHTVIVTFAPIEASWLHLEGLHTCHLLCQARLCRCLQHNFTVRSCPLQALQSTPKRPGHRSLLMAGLLCNTG